MIQFIKHVQEVSDVPRDAVKRSNERTSKRCGRASAKNWSSPGRLDFAPENYVAVLLHDFASAQFGHFAQVVKLCYASPPGIEHGSPVTAIRVESALADEKSSVAHNYRDFAA